MARGRYTQEKIKPVAEKAFGCKLLSTREAAAHYGICRGQLDNMVRAGRIPRPVRFAACCFYVAHQHEAHKRQMIAARRAQLKSVLQASG
jgi:predicted DNA-binding transcriptional regulator AlpA